MPRRSTSAWIWATTALKCGVAADATCTDVTIAPATNYTDGAVELFASTTYVIRTDEGGGNFNYGAIRVEFLGFDGSDAIMIFDWSFQLQSNNPNLAPSAGS